MTSYAQLQADVARAEAQVLLLEAEHAQDEPTRALRLAGAALKNAEADRLESGSPTMRTVDVVGETSQRCGGEPAAAQARDASADLRALIFSSVESTASRQVFFDALKLLRQSGGDPQWADEFSDACEGSPASPACMEAWVSVDRLCRALTWLRDNLAAAHARGEWPAFLRGELLGQFMEPALLIRAGTSVTSATESITGRARVQASLLPSEALEAAMAEDRLSRIERERAAMHSTLRSLRSTGSCDGAEQDPTRPAADADSSSEGRPT